MESTNPECVAENPEVPCPQCGCKNTAGYAQCSKCGYESVKLKCPNCGNMVVEADDAFCWKFKTKLYRGGLCFSADYADGGVVRPAVCLAL